MTPPLPPHTLILHIDTGTGWRGGQAQVYNLCRGLAARGVGVLLATPPGSALGARAEEAGIEVAALRMRGEFDLAAAWRLRRLAAGRGVSLVHAHDAHAHSLARLCLGAGAPFPVVVSRRVDFPVRRGWLSGRKYRDPRLHFLAISNGVREVLLQGGVPPERIDVAPSGVDPDRFDYSTPRERLRREFGIPADAPVIGTIGSLVDHKGHRYLVEAAPRVLARHPEARILIVGDGELRADLEGRIRALGLERSVLLPGRREDLDTFLAGFDVFALPSHLEGLCTSVIDALLFRLPVAACRTGGVPDLVRDGETGLLVEPRNPAALAGALLRLVEDRPLAARLGEAGRRHALAHFTHDHMVESTLAVLYARLLGRYAQL